MGNIILDCATTRDFLSFQLLIFRAIELRHFQQLVKLPSHYIDFVLPRSNAVDRYLIK